MKGKIMFAKIAALLAVPLGWVAFKAVSKANAATPAPGQASHPATGKSGRNWDVRFVKAFTTTEGKQTFWDVFLSGTRILRYSQLGELKGSRSFIDSPFATSDARVRDAAADFGVGGMPVGGAPKA